MEILALVALVAGMLLFCGIVGTVLTRARISAERKMIWGMIALWLLSIESLFYIAGGYGETFFTGQFYILVKFFYLSVSALVCLPPMIFIGLYGLRSIQSSVAPWQRVLSIITVILLAEAVVILSVYMLGF